MEQNGASEVDVYLYFQTVQIFALPGYLSYLTVLVQYVLHAWHGSLKNTTTTSSYIVVLYLETPPVHHHLTTFAFAC